MSVSIVRSECSITDASQRDKAQKNSYTGRHNTENSFRTKERDGSNRYNNSDTNREHERHPRY